MPHHLTYSQLNQIFPFYKVLLLLIVVQAMSCKRLDNDVVSQGKGKNMKSETINNIIASTEEQESLVLLDSFRFEDSTVLQIFTEEIGNSQKCHSCSPSITLKRSFRDYKGNVTWKETTLNVTSSWGKPGHFYLDELKENQDLLFYQGGYSQGGNSYTWINAFRIDESFFGDLSWTFDFKTGLDQSSAYSIAECKNLVPDGLTPVEVRNRMEGQLKISVSEGILQVLTNQNKFTAVYIQEDERTIRLNPKTVERDLYYSLEYGNVYLDSTYETRK
jgi:hypothetical protein